MEGYLKKKHPKITGRWDKRYVQLYDNKLMTFMNKDKSKINIMPFIFNASITLILKSCTKTLNYEILIMPL